MSYPSRSSNSSMDSEDCSDTTLFVGPVAGNLRHCDIISHFSAFGDVANDRIRNKRKYTDGFVESTLAESVAKALRVDSHVIAGRRVKIAVANYKHQVKTTLPVLNDDCILEILSMKCLNANDLCSVAEASRRLKEIASRAFKRQHKSCNISTLSKGKGETAKRILMHFGSEIRHFKIDGERFSFKLSREILTSVIEHCSSTLQSLDIENFVIPGKFTANLRPLFKNLQTLRIESCTFAGASKELLADCGSLVELNIPGYGSDVAFIFEKTFPKLQQFEYTNRADLLESFISRHMNLKSLILWDNVTSPLLQRIADCTQLETLACCIPENAILDLTNLGHLRKLEIRCEYRNVSKATLALKNLQFLEDLTLTLAKIDTDFVRTLSQLKGLQILKLWYCSRLQNLNRMGDLGALTTLHIDSNDSNKRVDLDVALLIKSLSKLNRLTVEAPRFEMDLATYLRIVDVVRGRTDQSKLTFRLSCEIPPHKYDNYRDDFARNAHLVEMIIDS